MNVSAQVRNALEANIVVYQGVKVALLPMPFQLKSGPNKSNVTINVRTVALDGVETPVDDAVPRVAICSASAKVVENVVAGTPGTVTSTAHGLTTGDKVAIDGVLGVSGVVGVRAVTVVDADSFTLDGSTVAGTFDPLSPAPKWYKVVEDFAVPSLGADGQYGVQISGFTTIAQGVAYQTFIYDTGPYAGEYWRSHRMQAS